MTNPKVIFYRNKDDSCYIILRIKENKHGVVYGVNGRNIESGKNAFSVYEVSKDMRSFMDNISRLIYADWTGLYFVPAEQNSVEKIVENYEKEGKFEFDGSVIKVSASDGTTTFNGANITEDNFYDNLIQKERVTEKQVSKEFGRTVIERVKETKIVPQTRRPNRYEILRNFYPPEGTHSPSMPREQSVSFDWSNAYGTTTTPTPQHLYTRNWWNKFMDRHFSLKKAKTRAGAEELVRNGSFFSNLAYHDNSADVRKIIFNKVLAKGGQLEERSQFSEYILNKVSPCSRHFFKDPNFVRSLKPEFAEISKNYEHNKESEKWLLFEIVKNL